MSKTYDLAAIMDLPISAILDYLDYAISQEIDQYAWELWKTLYPKMIVGYVKFISFEDFKANLFITEQKHSKKSNNEILSEMIGIVEAYRGR